jgi:hypothetical protein
MIAASPYQDEVRWQARPINFAGQRQATPYRWFRVDQAGGYQEIETALAFAEASPNPTRRQSWRVMLTGLKLKLKPRPQCAANLRRGLARSPAPGLAERRACSCWAKILAFTAAPSA